MEGCAMNHRERVLASLAHREPDRVARTANLTPGVVEAFRRETGQRDPGAYWDYDLASVSFLPPDPPPDLMARYGHYYADLEYEWVLDWEKSDFPVEWGVATRPAHFWHLSAPIAPLRHATSLADIAAFPFPDYLAEWRHDHLEAEVRRLQDAGYPVTAAIGWIFQTAWTIRSEVGLFADFYDNPEMADALLTRITDIRLAQAVRLAEAGVDMISINDDIGSQKSMIISPDMWRRWLKPRLASVIAAIHRVNPAIHFRYHSDGWIMPVIADLIAIGVSSLITVQPECMDVFEVKRRYGDRVCLEGTIGLQGELMHGTPDDVRRVIRAQCEGLKPGGGWIASPGNGVTPDVPFANLAAVYEALEEYGRY